MVESRDFHVAREQEVRNDESECDDDDSTVSDDISPIDDQLNEQVVSPECMALSALRDPPRKRQKTNHLTPITVGLINRRLGKVKMDKISILLDSGSSGSIVVDTLQYAGSVSSWLLKLMFGLLHPRCVSTRLNAYVRVD